MKLLLLTPQYPFPPHQGTTIRNFHLLRYLAARHDVHLLTFDAQPADTPTAADDPLPRLCQRITRVQMPPRRSIPKRAWSTLFSPFPDMALRLASEAMSMHLARLIREEEFDVVQVEGIEMAAFGFLVTVKPPGSRPLLVFDDHNAEYVLQHSAYETDRRDPRRWPGALYSRIQWRKLTRYEARCCRTFDRVVAVSDTDAAALRTLEPTVMVDVIPNGVDTAAYQPRPLPDDPAPTLVFTGKMDFRPNVDAMLWFCNHILPHVTSRAPDTRLMIVGQSPHPRLQPLARDPRVTLTGYVPDVRPLIAEAAVFVVPLRMGGGTRLKVLEAMAMGKAIVSTTLGCEGLDVVPGQEVVLADDEEQFADEVVALLNDPLRAGALGRRARAFVETRYAWDSITPLLEDVIRPAR